MAHQTDARLCRTARAHRRGPVGGDPRLPRAAVGRDPDQGRKARRAEWQLETGYFSPIWGDTDDGGGGDLVFLYRPSRAAIQVRERLRCKPKAGHVLISDSYNAFARYAEQTGITHAQYRAHTRRHVDYARDIEPEAVAAAPEPIGEIYACEQCIHLEASRARPRPIAGYRGQPRGGQAFFHWPEQQLQKAALLPSNRFINALNCALERRAGDRQVPAPCAPSPGRWVKSGRQAL